MEDAVYKTKKEKYVVVESVQSLPDKGQPVLWALIAIETSSCSAKQCCARGIPHVKY